MICGHCQRQSRSIARNWLTRSGERSAGGGPPYRRLVRLACHRRFRPNKARKRNGVCTPSAPRLKESRWQKSLRKYGRGWNQHVSLHHDARRCLPMPANARRCHFSVPAVSVRPDRIYRAFQGSSSLIRLILWSAMHASVSASHACGSTPFSLAVSISV